MEAHLYRNSNTNVHVIAIWVPACRARWVLSSDSVNHQISTKFWTSNYNCGSALCSEHGLSPNDSTTFVLRYNLLCEESTNEWKFMNLNAKTCVRSKVDFRYQTLAFHTFFWISKFSCLAENTSYGIPGAHAAMRILTSVTSICSNSHIYPISVELTVHRMCHELRLHGGWCMHKERCM